MMNCIKYQTISMYEIKMKIWSPLKWKNSSTACPVMASNRLMSDKTTSRILDALNKLDSVFMIIFII
jgi:hypothetical protein